MRIDGVDHLILERMQEEARRNISDAQQTDTDEQVRRDRQFQEMPAPTQERDWEEEVERAVNQLNDTARALNINMEFERDEEERMNVQLRNTEDDEIVRELPADELVNVVSQIQHMIGVILDERR